MIGPALLVLGVMALLAGLLAAGGEAGRAAVTWLGWRLDMTAAALVLLVALASLAAMGVWRGLFWILEAPRRAARARANARRRQGAETLTRGFLAVAAGDGAEARRMAAKASELAEESPGLVRLLAAQAAEAAGDESAARAAYTAMLSFPDLRLAGHRGLMLLAAAQGDRAGAALHAEAAFAQARTARWAWRAVLEARLEAGDWDAARDLLKSALDRRIVSPLVAERGRAALLAASAAGLESSTEPKSRAQALEFALEAARLQPGFAPGVVMAARRLAADGKLARAAAALESAWKAAPHPALWLAYRDLRTDETPRQRAGRLADLAALNPEARESRILQAELALIAGEPALALDAARPLADQPLTARIAGLLARAAFAAGQTDEARLWLARGQDAPREPDWSDLDPEGRAFAYEPRDWARLAARFAETGELIHPRFERREAGLSDLPDLPISYADTASLAPPGTAHPFPVGEGLFEDGAPDPERAYATPLGDRPESG